MFGEIAGCLVKGLRGYGIGVEFDKRVEHNGHVVTSHRVDGDERRKFHVGAGLVDERAQVFSKPFHTSRN
jgi:hypothetical protein